MQMIGKIIMFSTGFKPLVWEQHAMQMSEHT